MTVSQREFDDFKGEIRKQVSSLEQKLWGMVMAIFLLMVGFLFGQIQRFVSPPAAPAAALVLEFVHWLVH